MILLVGVLGAFEKETKNKNQYWSYKLDVLEMDVCVCVCVVVLSAILAIRYYSFTHHSLQKRLRPWRVQCAFFAADFTRSISFHLVFRLFRQLLLLTLCTRKKALCNWMCPSNEILIFSIHNADSMRGVSEFCCVAEVCATIFIILNCVHDLAINI